MGIIHADRHPNGYISVDRRAVDDERLSFGARGLLHYLLGRPQNWTVRVNHLASVGPDTDTNYKIKKYLKELKSFGYAVLKRPRSKDGTIAGSEWIIIEVPDRESDAADIDREGEIPNVGADREGEMPRVGHREDEIHTAGADREGEIPNVGADRQLEIPFVGADRESDIHRVGDQKGETPYAGEHREPVISGAITNIDSVINNGRNNNTPSGDSLPTPATIGDVVYSREDIEAALRRRQVPQQVACTLSKQFLDDPLDVLTSRGISRRVAEGLVTKYEAEHILYHVHHFEMRKDSVGSGWLIDAINGNWNHSGKRVGMTHSEVLAVLEKKGIKISISNPLDKHVESENGCFYLKVP